MTTFIGFLELVAWIVSVVGLAALITYVVVKLFPGEEKKTAQDAAETP
jgi:hypothetical protein